MRCHDHGYNVSTQDIIKDHTIMIVKVQDIISQDTIIEKSSETEISYIIEACFDDFNNVKLCVQYVQMRHFPGILSIKSQYI